MPLRGFDEELRIGLAEALSANGVLQYPSQPPVRIVEAGATRHLYLADGTMLEVDLVFFATGRAPNIRGLGLERAGVRTAEGGAVIVDEELQTSVPGVYAIGDVTDRLNLTPVATAEGHALADTLFGGKARRISLDNVPTAVFSSPPVATVGLTEDQAAARGAVKIFVTKFTPMRHTLSGRVRRSIMKLVVDASTDKVLGAHMLGEDAPEILQGIAIAITAGATKADFDRTIGIHPTAAEEFVTLRTQTRVAGVEQTPE
ncbi:MAG: hypothetical protein B7Z81_08415 [Acidocella sp. 20-61-6]|nr:MAG: hypothetical protein B7Z81_08415 [Acidocella sp. 20-61-6]